MERVMFLRSAPLATGLPDPALRIIAEVARERSFSEGQVLFFEGDLGTEMFLVVQGSVAVRKLARSGGRGRRGDHGARPPPDARGERLGRVLATLGPGDVVGEMSVLDDMPRSATVVAETEVRALSVHMEDLRDAIALCPDLAFGLFRVLSARLRATSASGPEHEGEQE
jgi:CRP/FNR family transcriptional regulator